MGRLFGRIERKGPFIDVKVMASPQRVTALKGDNPVSVHYFDISRLVDLSDESGETHQ